MTPRLLFIGLTLLLTHRATLAQTGGLPSRGVHADAQVSYDSFFGAYPMLSVRQSLDSLRELSAYAIYYPGTAFSWYGLFGGRDWN